MNRFFLATALFAFSLLAPFHLSAQVQPGDTPLLRATTLDGENVDSDALRGRVVLVDFWATWCKPCLSSLPAYDRLVEEIGADRIAVVGISIDGRRRAVARFVGQKYSALDFVWDDGQRLLRSWSPPTIPTVYLLAPTGRVHRVFTGFDDEHFRELREEVLELLGGAS